jgi:hypothetical protein
MNEGRRLPRLPMMDFIYRCETSTDEDSNHGSVTRKTMGELSGSSWDCDPGLKEYVNSLLCKFKVLAGQLRIAHFNHWSDSERRRRGVAKAQEAQRSHSQYQIVPPSWEI